MAEAVKIAARAHQKLVWERTRHLLRMRSALREYFPAALEAYAGLTLTGRTRSSCWARHRTRQSAARLTVTQITGRAQAGPAARRPGATGAGHPGRAARPHLAQPGVIAEAYAATVRASAAVISVLNQQVKTWKPR